MRPCLKAKDITKDVKRKLPIINELTFKEHFCSDCRYYAGRVDRVAHCMLKECSWDDEEEIYSPVLKKMLPIFEADYQKIRKKYNEAKARKEAIEQIFTKELEAEKRKNDPCNTCCYKTHAPCIGFCYLQMTGTPSDDFVERRKQNECNYNHGEIDQGPEL